MSGQARKGKRPRRGKKKNKKGYPLKWAILALGFLGAFILLAYLLPPAPVPPPQKMPPFEDFSAFPPSLEKKTKDVPLLKELDKPVKVLPSTKEIRPSKRPRIAIIIDDMGYDKKLNEAFLSMEYPISFAFLPHASYTDFLARRAKKMKRDVLVHLPLESSNDIYPGPGALLTSMSLKTMVKVLKEDLDRVPNAIGVNNHMGSKFTADKKSMEIVLAEVKRRGMFFVDSRTTKDTVAYQVAQSMGIPAAERHVFLDHDTRPEAIKKEIQRLEALAKNNGYALAIGHPHETTWKVLHDELPKLKKELEIVPVHQILEKNGQKK